jgi:hypothetical protein
MMKPQAMGSQEFFLALCRELGLSPTDSDEETIVRAVSAMKQELAATDMALSIVQAQVISLEIENDRLEQER